MPDLAAAHEHLVGCGARPLTGRGRGGARRNLVPAVLDADDRVRPPLLRRPRSPAAVDPRTPQRPARPAWPDGARPARGRTARTASTRRCAERVGTLVVSSRHGTDVPAVADTGVVGHPDGGGASPPRGRRTSVPLARRTPEVAQPPWTVGTAGSGRAPGPPGPRRTSGRAGQECGVTRCPSATGRRWPSRGCARARTGGWVTLVDGAAAGQRTRPPSVGRVVGRFVVANLIAVALLMAGSVWASGAAAKDEAISEARHGHRHAGHAAGRAVPRRRLPAGDPAAVAALDAVLRDRLAGRRRAAGQDLDPGRPDRLLRRAPADRADRTRSATDEQEALRGRRTRAELSDLSRPENRFERSAGRLLEVYRQIQTPDGQPLLFETYSSYARRRPRGRSTSGCSSPPISVGRAAGAAGHAAAAGAPAWSRQLPGRRARARAAAGPRPGRLRPRSAAGSPAACTTGSSRTSPASSLLVAGAAEPAARRAAPAGRGRRRRRPRGRRPRALRHSAGSLRSLLVEIYPPDLERGRAARPRWPTSPPGCGRAASTSGSRCPTTARRRRSTTGGPGVPGRPGGAAATSPSTPAPSTSTVTVRRRRRPAGARGRPTTGVGFDLAGRRWPAAHRPPRPAACSTDLAAAGGGDPRRARRARAPARRCGWRCRGR